MGSNNGSDEEVEELDEGEEVDENDVIVLIDENDEEHRFVMLALVEVDGEDYAMLAPEGQLVDEAGEELEIFLFHYEEDEDGRPILNEIEDPATFEKVQEFCSTLMDTGGVALGSLTTEGEEN